MVDPKKGRFAIKGIGVLDEILMELLKFVIMPLFRQQLYDETFNYQDHLGEFFNVRQREIYDAHVITPFRMPGKLRLDTTAPVTETWGRRKMEPNTPILIRVDNRYTNCIEIEQWPRREYEELFRLTRKQWQDIKCHLKITYAFHPKVTEKRKREVRAHHSFVVSSLLETEIHFSTKGAYAGQQRTRRIK